MKRVAIGVICLAALGCGSDYEPPRGTTTGIPAGSLAPVFDLEFDLPQLRIMNSTQPGVRVAMRIRLNSASPGSAEAEFLSGQAFWGMQSAELTRESGLPARVLHDSTSLSSDGLGPFRVGTTVFNVFFDAGATDGGWNFDGTATETQSGFPGEVTAWRQRRFLVAGTDFISNSGRISEVAWVRDERIEVRDGLEIVSSDPVLAIAGDAVFAVNRLFFDNLQRLDPASDFETAWQRTLSPGSNPQDVAGWEDLLFVSRYEAPFNDVAVLDSLGEQILDSIPLESVAENADGTPRAADLLRHGAWIYVAVQDIDRTFQTYGEGKLAAIDPAARSLIGSISLGAVNPTSVIAAPEDRNGPRIYVSLSGIYPVTQTQQLNGGVVAVDPVSWVVDRVVLDDDIAGGNLGPLAVAGGGLAYSVVSDANLHNDVIAWDPRDGTVLRAVRGSSYLIPSVTIGGGLLAIPDRAPGAPGLCLYRTFAAEPASNEIPLGCAPMALPPVSVVALDREVSP